MYYFVTVFFFHFKENITSFYVFTSSRFFSFLNNLRTRKEENFDVQSIFTTFVLYQEPIRRDPFHHSTSDYPACNEIQVDTHSESPIVAKDKSSPVGLS